MPVAQCAAGFHKCNGFWFCSWMEHLFTLQLSKMAMRNHFNKGKVIQYSSYSMGYYCYCCYCY